MLIIELIVRVCVCVCTVLIWAVALNKCYIDNSIGHPTQIHFVFHLVLGKVFKQNHFQSSHSLTRGLSTIET